jgi:hypothetical protein
MSPPVSVLVPYRPDSDERAVAWRHVAGWWASQFTTWEVITGAPPDGPWCKAAAVADALSRARGRVLVIADADVMCLPEHLRVLALMVGNGSSVRWGMPHRRVLRLTEFGTVHVLAGHTPPMEIQPTRIAPGGAGRRRLGALIGDAHNGVAGGGMVVVDRALYEQVPLDPRFKGWGQEDISWGHALTVMAGPPAGRVGPLWHLWHPPQQRLRRTIGSTEGYELMHRYWAATTPAQILALLAEVSETGDTLLA